MVKFETDGLKNATIEIKGKTINCQSEITFLINEIVKSNPQFEGSILLGIAMNNTKEDMKRKVEIAIQSLEIAKAMEKLQNFAPETSKKVDKNAEKCKNCDEKGIKAADFNCKTFSLGKIIDELIESLNKKGEKDE